MGAASGYPNASLTGTDKVLGENAAGTVKNFLGTEIGKLNVEGQTLAGGAGVTAKALTIPASPDVPIVIDPSARPLQYIYNFAPFTIAAPTVDGSCLLLIINASLVSPDVAGGAVTFSGFSVGSSTGDTITTTAGAKFTVNIWRINGVSGYNITAHQ